MLKSILAVLLMALVTYLPRSIPISLFRKEIHSAFLQSFLYYVPYAVLGSLTFPDIFSSTGSFFTACIGTFVALFLSYKEKGLVTVAVGAIGAVYLSSFLQNFF